MAHMHTKEQVKTKFDGLRECLKGVSHRARWHNMTDMAVAIENALQMVDQLEREYDGVYDDSKRMD